MTGDANESTTLLIIELKKKKVELLYKSEKAVKYLGVTIPYHQFLQS